MKVAQMIISMFKYAFVSKMIECAKSEVFCIIELPLPWPYMSLRKNEYWFDD